MPTVNNHTTERLYAAVSDISPSEQLGVPSDDLKSLVVVVANPRQPSFDLVGSKHDAIESRLRLRKWSGAKKRYKDQFVNHARTLVETPATVIPGSYVANDRAIRNFGRIAVERVLGPIPEPCDFSKQGRPRIALGGYLADGVLVPRYKVLRDDLLIIGWLADAYADLTSSLQELDPNKPVRIGVISDHLPHDPDNRKATLLRFMVSTLTDGRCDIEGLSPSEVEEQRDLFVDNLAGLCRQIEHGTWQGSSDALDLFRFHRRDVHRKDNSHLQLP